MEKIKLTQTVTEQMLETVFRKYHFNEEDKELLWDVGQQIAAIAYKQGGFWCRNRTKNEAVVLMTLGKDVDTLQDDFCSKGELSGAYMAEAWASELLLAAYDSFAAWVEQETGYHIAQYRFPGEKGKQDDTTDLAKEDSLETLYDLLDSFDQTEVICNQANCLIPKKSVIFFAELTKDETVSCKGICHNCGKKDCPFRVQGKAEEKIYWPDLTQRVLPYGYARIWGKL